MQDTTIPEEASAGITYQEFFFLQENDGLRKQDEIQIGTQVKHTQPE